MRKMLVFLLGLLAALYFGYTYFQKATPPPGDEVPSSAKTRLDNVREKARAIEADDERRNREALEKTEGK